MSSELIINSTPEEARVAHLEHSDVVELYVEREKEKGIVGNVYKGKIVRVLPGMQAAFVDIGLEKAAFLYAADIHEGPDSYTIPLDEGEEVDVEFERPVRSGYPAKVPQIQELVHEGQELLVQVAKAPMGTKGARITTHIAIAGRNLVLTPYYSRVGVSRRIDNEKERQRLRKIVMEAKPQNVGLIVRTVCANSSRKKITTDIEYLLKQWEEIRRIAERAQAPAPAYSDLSLTLRTVRDLVTEDIERIVVDSPQEYDRIIRFVNTFVPRLRSAIELYKGKTPIFEFYGVEEEIRKALNRKVWLKSGGYIITDEAEALVSIDVNTGRFVGRKNLADTILKTNLEASVEIARQLRLRNCGGIIIVDFIDMDNSEDRERVYRTFENALKKDRSKTNILKISELGLLEMTRKRTRESLRRTLCTQCPYCDGKAYVKSKTTICYDIFRSIMKDLNNEEIKGIVIYVNPEVAETLNTTERSALDRLRQTSMKTITVKIDPNFHVEQFDVFALK